MCSILAQGVARKAYTVWVTLCRLGARRWGLETVRISGSGFGDLSHRRRNSALLTDGTMSKLGGTAGEKRGRPGM
ncbi:hypothetical protein GQ53DRAFT_742862 [Thozetella sp. PMI_491]|nr:hypothetical protein GQ53DRAFT_742862 [Thozetella sp. PMI_491]